MTVPAKTRVSKNNTFLKKVEPYLYLLPALSVFSLFTFYPFFRTLYLSLFITNKMGLPRLFVGLNNYTSLLRSDSFYNSIAVTAEFVAVVVILGILLGLAAALLCSRPFPGIRIFSTSYALPMAVASSSAAMIFQVMLHPSIGIVDKIFGTDINWVADPAYALICVSVLTAWLNSGINFLYLSAGLSGIEPALYESASVDGANGFQKFLHITLPGLSPVLFFTVTVNIILSFQSFGQVKILTQGGPGEATNLIVYSIYRDAFFNYRFGSAAAESIILFLIIMMLTLLMFRSEKGSVNYQ